MAEAAAKKQHMIEYIAIAVLVIVAIIIGASRFKKTEKNDEVFTRQEFNKKWKEVEILEANAPKPEKAVAYTAVTGNEKIPFQSPFDVVVRDQAVIDEKLQLPGMQFQGMVWKGSRPQAIINNGIYDVKDVIKIGEEEITVKDILQDGIHLVYKGKEFIVRPK